jgi:hypothetical protein
MRRKLTVDDRDLLKDILDATTDDECIALIVQYYRDADRADRTPRPVLYLHIGLLCGMAQRIAALKN